MLNKKLIPAAAPVVALIMLVAAMVTVGAQPKPAVNIPPGEIVVSPNARMQNDTPRRAVPAAPVLAAGQPGATTETFDGKSLDAWRGITDAPISWVASESRLQQYLPLEESPSEQPALFVSKAADFVDGTVQAHFYATSGSPLGLVLRGSDQGYYRVLLHMNVSTNTVSKAHIERVTPTGVVVLAEAPVSAFAGYNLESWQLLSATIQGNTITVSVDGNQIMSATDSTLTQGWAGVWTLADQGASFDNLRIQPTAVR